MEPCYDLNLDMKASAEWRFVKCNDEEKEVVCHA